MLISRASIVIGGWTMGAKAFHLSHQSNLVRKDATFYGPLFPGVGPDLEYVWPCRSGQ